MKTQKPKKRHHYIPVFYLNGFINSTGTMWVYDKEDKGMFESTPDGIAYEKHYFTVKTEDGKKDSEIIENYVATLESEFSKVLSKILTNKPLSNEDKTNFAWFVASMMTRTPNFRNNIQKATSEMIQHVTLFMASHKKNFEQMVKRYEKDTGNKIEMPVEEFRQSILDTEKYTIGVDSQYAMGVAFKQMEKLVEIFFNMKWAYLKAIDGYKFFTGDNPLSYVDPTHNPQSFRGVGLLNKKIEVTLPLSKELCAFGTWDTKLKEGYLQIKKEMIKDLNRRTLMSSRRFVFTHFKSDSMDKFVKKYKGSHLVATTN
jgi:hypothetical protein